MRSYCLDHIQVEEIFPILLLDSSGHLLDPGAFDGFLHLLHLIQELLLFKSLGLLDFRDFGEPFVGHRVELSFQN